MDTQDIAVQGRLRVLQWTLTFAWLVLLVYYYALMVMRLLIAYAPTTDMEPLFR